MGLIQEQRIYEHTEYVTDGPITVEIWAQREPDNRVWGHRFNLILPYALDPHGAIVLIRMLGAALRAIGEGV